MDFVAFDFETANRHNHACSLGLAVVENNAVVKTMHWLINPEAEFDPFNVSIHHITADDVADAPTFGELWGEISEYICKYPLVAHNAPFDRSVLRRAARPDFGQGKDILLRMVSASRPAAKLEAACP